MWLLHTYKKQSLSATTCYGNIGKSLTSGCHDNGYYYAKHQKERVCLLNCCGGRIRTVCDDLLLMRQAG